MIASGSGVNVEDLKPTSWFASSENGLFIGLLPHQRENAELRRFDGDRLQVGNPSTYGTPDGHFQGEDAKGRPIEIFWWNQLHAKEARWLEFTVARVVRPHANNSERDPRESWFAWLGDPQVDVPQVVMGYTLRFGQEHGYRFDKQSLLWEQPRLHTPEQFERWSHVVAIAHNHLVLATPLVEPELRLMARANSVLHPYNRCVAGLTNYCLSLATLPDPPNPVEKRKAGLWGRRSARERSFQWSTKSPKCLNLYHPDDALHILL